MSDAAKGAAATYQRMAAVMKARADEAKAIGNETLANAFLKKVEELVELAENALTPQAA